MSKSMLNIVSDFLKQNASTDDSETDDAIPSSAFVTPTQNGGCLVEFDCSEASPHIGRAFDAFRKRFPKAELNIASTQNRRDPRLQLTVPPDSESEDNTSINSKSSSFDLEAWLYAVPATVGAAALYVCRNLIFVACKDLFPLSYILGGRNGTATL